MDYDEIEKRLVAACDEAIRQGWKISQNVTVDLKNKCCCPYGAAQLVDHKFNPDLDYHCRVYDTQIPYVSGFVVGFDSGTPNRDDDFGSVLGYKFYQKYILHVNG